VTPHDWDATTYDRVATGVKALGHEVLDRLELRGDETVLDAGCGPGEITAALAARLPRGRVIAFDASAQMVDAARARLNGGADVRHGDLLELDLGGEQVHAVFSTATFHWVADHERLFTRLRAALRTGGTLVAQCGGEGNIAELQSQISDASAEPPFAEHVGGFDPWNFAGPQETEERLRGAGFAQARCWLEPRTVAMTEPRSYMATIMLGAHLERLPPPLRDDFTDLVTSRLAGPPLIDYVRLNIDAVA
jgi:trans-aconitate 2-methyltransferase